VKVPFNLKPWELNQPCEVCGVPCLRTTRSGNPRCLSHPPTEAELWFWIRSTGDVEGFPWPQVDDLREED
jgi:hypothetical protein